MKKALMIISLIASLCGMAKEQTADWKPTERWRGFNLTELFMRHSANVQPKEFRESDFQMIHDWGFNFVRLPMDYRFWIKWGKWEEFDEKGLQVIDRAVEFGKKYGIHVQICMHRIPGYTVAKPKEKTDLFSDQETLRVACKHWAMFARRYKGIPNERVSFNLFNEPSKVNEEDYARVVKKLVEAIRAEDPERFIVADGIDWGKHPVKLLAGIPGLGQSTRGYAPMCISHYKARWVDAPDVPPPKWPLPLFLPEGPLTGSGKKDMQSSFVISNLPPSKITFAYGKVSRSATIRFTADGKTVAEEVLKPKKGDAMWENVEWIPQWKIFQGFYSGTTEIELPHGAKRIEAFMVQGDWSYLKTVRVTSLNNEATVELPILTLWGKPRNFVQSFAGFDAVMPFVSTEAVQCPKYSNDEGMRYLYYKLVEPWDELLSTGTFAMAGEFGCYNHTPHQLALDWMEDYLRLWKERNMGWALWNFRGRFGILDSGRTDVEYEDFNGHKLDRKMLDLLKKY